METEQEKEARMMATMYGDDVHSEWGTANQGAQGAGDDEDDEDGEEDGGKKKKKVSRKVHVIHGGRKAIQHRHAGALIRNTSADIKVSLPPLPPQMPPPNLSSAPSPPSLFSLLLSLVSR